MKTSTLAAWLTASTLLASWTPALSAEPALGSGATPPFAWHASTSSPRPVEAAREPLYQLCGPAEQSLEQVARRSAMRQLRGEATAGGDELAASLRAAGGPYLWPRLWSLRGGEVSDEELARRVSAWLGKSATTGQRRCGIVRTELDSGERLVTVTTVDALADLESLPTVTRSGAWLSLRARMLVPANDAKVVLLGPRGAPRTVLASLSGDTIRASFVVDQPGSWLVQVLATVSIGPRPVLEARIQADGAPPFAYASEPAPGEDAGAGPGDERAALSRMIDAARASERLPKLTASAELTRVAQEHTDAMIQKRTVGHDVGEGDWTERLLAAGVPVEHAGENVASASSLSRAHRALWASPSHRANLLDPRFTRIGLGIRKTDDGRVWVTQVFAR